MQIDLNYKYTHSVNINSAGQYWILEIGENQVFLIEQLPQLQSEQEIQSQLIQWMKQDDRHRERAVSCLSCFISHKIKALCQDLEQRFGQVHDFTSIELFMQTLEGQLDDSESRQSLTTRILETFNPDKGSLSAWISRMFKSDRHVKRFLLEHGMELVTNWKILNYTKLGKLEQILSTLQQTKFEIDQDCQLLEIYHEIYRDVLPQNRKSGARLPEPTEEQLRQIGEQLSPANPVASDEVFKNLQRLASILRKASINLKKSVTQSDRQETENDSESLVRNVPQVKICLERAIKQVIDDRCQTLVTKNTSKAHKFLKALYLFHCQSKQMRDIAEELGLSDQPQVSRLLNLKKLRKDIERNTVLCLQTCIAELAQTRFNPEKLKEAQEYVSKKIGELVQEAAQEAKTGSNRVMKSLLAQRICQYLKTRQEIS